MRTFTKLYQGICQGCVYSALAVSIVLLTGCAANQQKLQP